MRQRMNLADVTSKVIGSFDCGVGLAAMSIVTQLIVKMVNKLSQIQYKLTKICFFK